jgi:hypothetical protein
MNIQWSITKKRGNLRPVLNYTVTLTDFEKSLGMGAVRIESAIPKPPDAGWAHCHPGENERGDWTPEEFHFLMTPSHRTGKAEADLKLPWREDNSYPEVEASFKALRDAFEEALAGASASKPMQLSGCLETSGIAKKTIAPAFAAERILKVVGR